MEVSFIYFIVRPHMYINKKGVHSLYSTLLPRDTFAKPRYLSYFDGFAIKADGTP